MSNLTKLNKKQSLISDIASNYDEFTVFNIIKKNIYNKNNNYNYKQFANTSFIKESVDNSVNNNNNNNNISNKGKIIEKIILFLQKIVNCFKIHNTLEYFYLTIMSVALALFFYLFEFLLIVGFKLKEYLVFVSINNDVNKQYEQDYKSIIVELIFSITCIILSLITVDLFSKTNKLKTFKEYKKDEALILYNNLYSNYVDDNMSNRSNTTDLYCSEDFNSNNSNINTNMILSFNDTLYIKNIKFNKEQIIICNGIPELKLIISGIKDSNYFNLSSFISKAISLYFALLSGAYICNTEPYIHLTCCISVYFSYYFKSLKNSYSFFTNSMSVTAAIALSLSMNAPLTGALMSIELTSNLLLSTTLWKYFYSSILSFIIKRFIYEGFKSSIYYTNNNNYNESSLKLSNDYIISHINQAFKYHNEFLLIIILSIVIGLIGGYIIKTINIIVSYKNKLKEEHLVINNNNAFSIINKLIIYLKKIIKNKYIYSSIIIILITLTTSSNYFLKINKNKQFINLIVNENQLNNIATNINQTNNKYILEDTKILVDKKFINNNTVENNTVAIAELTSNPIFKYINENMIKSNNKLSSLLKYTFQILFITLISQTLDIPKGFIYPCFLLGTLLGSLYGYVFNYFFILNLPSIYSIIGGVSLISSLTHTFSIAIYVLEISGQSTYLLPALLACIISIYSSKLISDNIFDCFLQSKNMPCLTRFKKQSITNNNLTASNIYIPNSLSFKINDDILFNNNNNISNKNNGICFKEAENNNQISSIKLSPNLINKVNINKEKSANNSKKNIINNSKFMDLTLSGKSNYLNNAIILDFTLLNSIKTLCILLENNNNNNINTTTTSIPVINQHNKLNFIIEITSLLNFSLILIIIFYIENNEKLYLNCYIKEKLIEIIVLLCNEYITTKTQKNYLLYLINKYYNISNINKSVYNNVILDKVINTILNNSNNINNTNNKYLFCYKNLKQNKKETQQNLKNIINEINQYCLTNKNCILNCDIFNLKNYDYELNNYSFDTLINKILEVDNSIIEIEKHFCISKIYELFEFLNVKNIYVTENNVFLGIITKKEFINKLNLLSKNNY